MKREAKNSWGACVTEELRNSWHSRSLLEEKSISWLHSSFFCSSHLITKCALLQKRTYVRLPLCVSRCDGWMEWIAKVTTHKQCDRIENTPESERERERDREAASWRAFRVTSQSEECSARCISTQQLLVGWSSSALFSVRLHILPVLNTRQCSPTDCCNASAKTKTKKSLPLDSPLTSFRYCWFGPQKHFPWFLLIIFNSSYFFNNKFHPTIFCRNFFLILMMIFA